MSELPEGWAQVPIGTVARIVGGGTPPSKDPANFALPGQGTPWITPADLSGYRAQTIERGARDLSPAGLATCGAMLMPKGTVLFSSRAPIGYVAIAANEISTNQGFKSFILPDGFDPRFTYYQLKHLKPEAEAIATGTTFKELSGAATSTLPFKVSPLNEQTRIAEQLDKLLARIQACNDRIDAIPALLKRFRQAVLSAAVSGRLTDDWRDEDGTQKQTPIDGLWSIPASWRWAKAEDECGFITKGTTPSKEKMQSGNGQVPYIKVYNLGFNGKLDFTIDPTFVESRTHAEELKRSIVLPGDVLMNIVGPPLGKVSVVPDSHPEWNINQAIARFRPGPNLRSAYLASCLLSSGSVEHAISKSKATAGQWNLTLEICRALPLPIPSLAEQDEIIRRLQRFMLVADRIEARYIAARAQALRLTSLLLAKAFRGELVQQDPQDEPASVLLERIAATTPAKARTSRGRPRIQPERQSAIPELAPADWASLPDGAWSAPEDPEGQATMVWLTAVLRAWGEPMPERGGRLAVLLCQQPRLFTAVLSAAVATQWSRLVGDEASRLPMQVLSFRPAINSHWGRAIKGMRARGDLVEAGLDDSVTWALGPGAAGIETAGWPDGRARFVVAHLRAHGMASVLPLLELSAQEFVDARAA